MVDYNVVNTRLLKAESLLLFLAVYMNGRLLPECCLCFLTRMIATLLDLLIVKYICNDTRYIVMADFIYYLVHPIMQK